MGGNYWQDNGDGTFTRLNQSVFIGYSYLDLYLMGFLAEQDVPDFFLIENFGGVANPIVSGNRLNLTVGNVIAHNGPRLPSFENSQKDFNMGFVGIVQNQQLPSLMLLERMAGVRQEWLEFWPIATGGVSTMTSSPYSTSDFTINAGLNDAWVSADAALQGFFFTVFPDFELFFLAMFTFDSVPPGPGIPPAVFGAADQRWLSGLGAYSGDSVTINVELTSGGIFNASDPLATQESGYGTITIVFINCNEAVLTYNFPSVGLSGQMTLTRAAPDNVSLCEILSAP